MVIASTRGTPAPAPTRPMGWDSSDRLAAGWIPVDIDARMSVIRWVQMDSWDPSEPFLNSWVSKLRTRTPVSREVETEVPRLRRAVSRLPTVTPSGLIFHVSRCGSTLVSNALAVAEDTFVLREVPAMDRAMGFAGSPSRYWSLVGLECLSDLTTAFAFCCGQPPRRVVIKTGFCGIACLRAVRALWPSVPCLVLIREPLAVVVSNIARPNKLWVDWHADPNRCPFGAPPRDVLHAGLRAFCAWTIGRMCEEALECLDQHCLVLDYDDLAPDSVARVGSEFGLKISDDRCRLFDDVFGRDAKHPERRFAGDAEVKRRSATHSMVEAVERWALSPYRRLLTSELRIRSAVGRP